MHLITWAALAAAAVAVIALLLASDAWFFGFLSLACLMQGTSEAYQEHRLSVLGCLIAGAFFAGAAFRSLFTGHAAHGGGS